MLSQQLSADQRWYIVHFHLIIKRAISEVSPFIINIFRQYYENKGCLVVRIILYVEEVVK